MSAEAVVASPIMCALYEEAKRVAAYPTTVLIEGETGVGKEVLANWIHACSPRRNMPFIKLNCASIPEPLLESELFGYERGAFTGAKREGNPGLFELADKGTLLLDEVGELSPAFQAKLLRVLQDREVRRVGGSWSRVIDVRILACTNRNLRERVHSGHFREDLYYRLQVVTLRVPPLRERPEDIPVLLETFLRRFSDEFHLIRTFSDAAWQALQQYSYPGNVRELRNLVESLCVRSNSETIDWDDLPAHVRFADKGPDCIENHSLDSQLKPTRERRPRTLREIIEATERQALTEALASASSIRAAAASLGISHATLLRKMRQYGIRGRQTPR
jgi:two-component system response regulator AtoC